MAHRRKQIPGGLRDYLPEELVRRRELERHITTVFNRWGYEELMTPTLEFVDVLASGGGHGVMESTYRFFDADGEFVALRPEMTTPIARLVSTRLRSRVDPGRFWYLSSVFRYADPQAGHRREFCQAGVEIIGSRSVLADAETIALCVDCLDECGLRSFGIDIGHMGFVNGLMKDIGLDDDVSVDMKVALLHQDIVGFKSMIVNLDLCEADKNRLLSLVDLRGDGSILDKGREIAGESPAAKEAIGELESVVHHLECYGAARVVCIDLGLVKNFDYYTGVIFQGYAQGVGYGICGGGRYDNLLAQFGFECPSTGFAIGIERVLAAIEQGNPESLDSTGNPSCVIVFENGSEEVALSDARLLRDHGFVVEIELDGRPTESVCERARRRGHSFVLSYSQEYLDETRCYVLADPDETDSLVRRLADVLHLRTLRIEA